MTDLQQPRGTTVRHGALRSVVARSVGRDEDPDYWDAWKAWGEQHGVPVMEVVADEPVVCNDVARTITFTRMVMRKRLPGGALVPLFINREFQTHLDRVWLERPAAPMPGEEA